MNGKAIGKLESMSLAGEALQGESACASLHPDSSP